MTKETYLLISPRGFANETFIVHGSAASVAAADSIISDDPSAWSSKLSASSPAVRRAQREAARWGVPIARLKEEHVTRHRPEYLHDDGYRSLGRGALPA